MKVKALAILTLAAAVFSLAARPSKPTAQSPQSLVLLYTSGANGQIRSCNCTKFRFGGYGRQLTLLKAIRAESKDVVLVEGGDMCGGSGLQASLKADVAAQALHLLGYNAMVPGEEELGVRGTSYIERFAVPLKPPSTPAADPKPASKTKPASTQTSATCALVCANLFKEGETKPVYSPYVVVKTAGGLRVAVVGLIDEALCSPWLSMSTDKVVKDPIDVLPAVVKEARDKADLVVVIYHGVVGASSALADINGIDLILSTHPNDQDRIFPAEDSNTVDAPVDKLGGAVLVKSGTSTNWCVGKLDIALSADRRIAGVKHKLLYLDRAYDEDPAMVKVYDDYSEKVKQATLKSASAFKKQAEAMLTKRGLNIVEMRQRLRKSVFATAAKCKDCHPEIYQIWSDSRHAHAMATLQKTHQEYDPECVRCHVTGAAVRNGFVNAKETPELGNVQCEACHGPARVHLEAPKKGFGKAGEQTCRSCHTAERTPDFDYAVAWAKIMH